MKVVIVSDTHRQHAQLGTLAGDVLIHCGDSELGIHADDAEVERLDRWFGAQRFDLVLCIGGNHDFALQARAAAAAPVLRHAVYLEDAAFVHRGVTFYGAPWVPELSSWAYYQPPAAIRDKWREIPAATDVLVTHSPPQGVLDRNSGGKSCGCPELMRRVAQLRPRLHCFGHVHASAGSVAIDGTTYVNASVVDSRYRIARPPREFSL